MPIDFNVDNSLELFVMRFSGSVTAKQVSDAIASVAARLGTAASYRSLLIFDRSTDLSAIDKEALQHLQDKARDTLYRIPQRHRRGGAAMVDGSQDAKLIVPLWNALSDCDPQIDMHFDIFTELEPALAWLDIAPEQGGLTVNLAESWPGWETSAVSAEGRPDDKS